MLLRLVPEPPLPTVLFTLAFPNLPDGVPFPLNWTAQLQHVLQDELEMPNCIHALDKAAWAVCLLHEVNFCVASKVISCVFVDGTRCDWPLQDERCINSLQSVLDDVNESSVAGEMEQRRAKAIASPAPSRPESPARGSKHKKSRSILMTLVASLVPSSSQLSSSPLPPYEPPVQVTLPPEPAFSSRFLRRKARAALVDVYCQYVVPELGSPFAQGGYVFWILQSMLRRIEGRMSTLVQELGGEQPGPRTRVRPTPSRLRTSPSALSEFPFEDDESSSSSSATETDTDASSVHTPRDSLTEYPFMCRTAHSDDALINAENGFIAPNPLTSSPRSHETVLAKPRQEQQGPLAEYTMLHASTVRLRALLIRTEFAERGMAADRAAHLAILEVKSKRRAWSAHALLGRANAAHAGLGTPLRSSPLARCAVITPETLEARGRYSGLGIVRTPAGRRRLGTIHESDVERVPQDVYAEDGALVAPPFCVPSQGVELIPFPQTESGDDFCSTGPQDPLPLFAHPSETEAEKYECVDDELASSPYALLQDMYSAADTYADPPVVPLDVYAGAFDPTLERGCAEFTHALDLKAYAHAHPLSLAEGSGPGCARSAEWLVKPVADCR